MVILVHRFSNYKKQKQRKIIRKKKYFRIKAFTSSLNLLSFSLKKVIPCESGGRSTVCVINPVLVFDCGKLEVLIIDQLKIGTLTIKY